MSKKNRRDRASRATSEKANKDIKDQQNAAFPPALYEATRATLSCSVCAQGPTTVCSSCHEARYCSKACQKIDWTGHKTVCKASIGPRPSNKHIRALYLPDTEHEPTPRLIWLKTMDQVLDLSKFSDLPFSRTPGAPKIGTEGGGNDNSVYTSRTPMLLSTEPLDVSVHVLNRALFFYSAEMDVAVPAHPWSGPCFIATEQEAGGQTAYTDFSWRDFRPMLAKLSQVGEHWDVLNFKSPKSSPSKLYLGALLACQGEVELLGTKPTELIELYGSGVSELVGLAVELYVRKPNKTLSRPCPDTQHDSKTFRNPAANILLVSVNENFDSWGAVPDDFEGNVLLRSGRKPSVEDIGLLTAFCMIWSNLASRTEAILKPTPSQRKEMQAKYVTPVAFQRFKNVMSASKRPETEYLDFDEQQIAQKIWDLNPKMSLVFRGIGIGTRMTDPTAPDGVRGTPFASCPQM